MANDSKSEFTNDIRAPLDFLWDARTPLRVRVLMLIAHWRPSQVDIGTICNVTRCNRTQVRDVLKVLAREGRITRSNGKASLTAMGLPEADAKGLRAFRGFQGKHTKIPGVPVPLRQRLLARDEASAQAVYFRFPLAAMTWMLAKDAFAQPAWWSRQLPKRIEDSKDLTQRGQILLKFLEAGGVEVESITATEALVTHTVEALWATEKRGNPVRSVPAMLTRLLKDAETRPEGDGDDDQLTQVAHEWRDGFIKEPVEERHPASAFLTEHRLRTQFTEAQAASTPNGPAEDIRRLPPDHEPDLDYFDVDG